MNVDLEELTMKAEYTRALLENHPNRCVVEINELSKFDAERLERDFFKEYVVVGTIKIPGCKSKKYALHVYKE